MRARRRDAGGHFRAPAKLSDAAEPPLGAGSIGLIAALFVLTLIVVPWRLVDPDELSHLASGRVILERGEVPQSDPFTFTRPNAAWDNPEWLGDVVWFLAYRAGGVMGMVVLKLALIALAWLLVLRQSRQHLAVTAVLLLLLLPSCMARFTARNDLHVLWLIPAFHLLASSLDRHPRRWAACLALGWVWSNLHASFILGGLIIGASLLQQGLRDHRMSRATMVVLALYPMLPLAGPHGLALYRQLWDHVAGAPIYREIITEWKSPLSSPALAALAPFYLCSCVAVLSLWQKETRARLDAVLLMLAGLALAWTSRRFIPIGVVLGAPSLAGALGRWCATWTTRRRVRWGTVCVLLGSLLASFSVHLQARRPGVLDARARPWRAARFISRHAPTGARLFNPFNVGPWLLWLTAPRVKHLIDPRNNLGAKFLEEYVTRFLSDRDHFRAESARLGVTLALVDLGDVRFKVLTKHLDEVRGWQPVYGDGAFILYAREVAENSELIARFGQRYPGARPAPVRDGITGLQDWGSSRSPGN